MSDHAACSASRACPRGSQPHLSHLDSSRPTWPLQDCSIVISPITAPECSEPGSTDYDYAKLQLLAYYQTTTKIRSLLPASGDNGGSSAAMLALDPASGESKTADLKFWSATSKPSDYTTATAAANLCSTNLAVAGGTVVAKEADACPAGSYTDADKICPPW